MGEKKIVLNSAKLSSDLTVSSLLFVTFFFFLSNQTNEILNEIIFLRIESNTFYRIVNDVRCIYKLYKSLNVIFNVINYMRTTFCV